MMVLFLLQKRRSARNTKRKKYLDELELNLSEEENADVDVEGTGASGVASMKSVQFFVVSMPSHARH